MYIYLEKKKEKERSIPQFRGKNGEHKNPRKPRPHKNKYCLKNLAHLLSGYNPREFPEEEILMLPKLMLCDA